MGLSILSGAHMTLVPRIVELLAEQGVDDVVVTVGGTIPGDDIPQLKELGVAEVFTPGAPTQAIIDFIQARSRVADAQAYSASFGPSDPPELVASCFACPYCLHLRSEAFVVRGDAVSEAICSCRSCGEHWTLALDAWQTTRLVLAPPPRAAGSSVHLVFAAA